MGAQPAAQRPRQGNPSRSAQRARGQTEQGVTREQALQNVTCQVRTRILTGDDAMAETGTTTNFSYVKGCSEKEKNPFSGLSAARETGGEYGRTFADGQDRETLEGRRESPALQPFPATRQTPTGCNWGRATDPSRPASPTAPFPYRSQRCGC